jgi:hypothetical protein
MQTSQFDLETCLLALYRTAFFYEDLSYDVLQTLYVFWSLALYRLVFCIFAELSSEFLQAQMLSSSVFFGSADLLLVFCRPAFC